MKAWRLLLVCCFVINMYVLLTVILFKMSTPQLSSIIQQINLLLAHPYMLYDRIQSANFVPFHTIKQSFEMTLAPIQWLNIYGNIVLFLPTGIIIALWSKKHHIENATLISLLISLCLELSQLLLLMGSFDVDDLILNTLGGAIGSLLIVAGKKMAVVVKSSTST